MAFKTDAQRRWFFANRALGPQTQARDPRTKTGRAWDLEQRMRKEYRDEARSSAGMVRERRAELDARLKRGEISQQEYANELSGTYQSFALENVNLRDRFAAIAQVAQREQAQQRSLSANEALERAWPQVARDNFEVLRELRRSPHSVLAETATGEAKARHQYYAGEGPFERKRWQWKRGDTRPASVKRENERLSGNDRFFYEKAQERAIRLRPKGRARSYKTYPVQTVRNGKVVTVRVSVPPNER